MNKVFEIRNYLVPLDSIVCIQTYEDEYLEPIGENGKIWFPLCLFKKETWQGKPVIHSYFGGRYVSNGKVKMMVLYLSNEKQINTDYDEGIVRMWKASKVEYP